MVVPTEWSRAVQDERPPVLLKMLTSPVQGIGVGKRDDRWSGKVSMAVLLVAFLCAFFTQYQAVAPCVFGLHAAFLSFIHIEHRRWVQWLGSLLVGLGLALSISQIFRPSGQIGFNWMSFGIMLGIQVFVIHVFLLFAVIHLRLCHRYAETYWFPLFTYPVLVTSTYALVAAYSPIASQGSIGYALWEFQSFIQIGSVFGLTGLNLIIVTVGTMIAHATFVKSRGMFAKRVGLSVFVINWLFGSFRLLSPLTYQLAIEETAAPASEWVATACIVGSPDGDVFNDMIERTTLVASQGVVEVILWSETAYDYSLYDNTNGETLTQIWQSPKLSSFKNELSRVSADNGVLIGATYRTYARPNDMQDTKMFNWLTFFDPIGGVVAEYAKRNPVPVIERHILASNDDVVHGESSIFHQFNAAICFDLDNPDFIRKGIDTGLLIQTANTWGIVGYYHGINSAFRAIENGVYLVRCGSKGPSGVWDFLGNQLAYQTRNDKDVVYMQVPRNPARVWTFYSHIGFAIDYVLYAISLLYLGRVFWDMRRRAIPNDTNANAI